MATFEDTMLYTPKLEVLRYVAQERFVSSDTFWIIAGPSKEGDVYSLAMVSFKVYSSVVKHPTA